MEQLVIDADGHVFEDAAAIAKLLGEPYGYPYLGVVMPVFPSLDGRFRKPGEGKLGVTRVEDWSQFLDDLGLQGGVIYPTQALALGLVEDAGYAVALAQAYNDWMADTFLRRDRRLHAMALLPPQDVEAAVRELRRGVKELGMRGGLLPSVLWPRAVYGQRRFDPLWAAAEELDCGIAIHGAPQAGLGLEAMPTHMMAHVLEHAWPHFLHLTSMVLGGVFERFPRLRVAYLEAATGWLPYLMDKMDTEYAIRGPQAAPECRRLPSEYVRGGQVYCSAEISERGLSYTLTRFPADRVLYASDFPHERELPRYKEELEELMQRPDLTPEHKRAIVWDSARAFYGLAP